MPRRVPAPVAAEGRLVLSTEAILWEEGSGTPAEVAVYSDTRWRVVAAPWWLRTARHGDSLVLAPTVAGPLQGDLVVAAGRHKARVRLATAPSAPRPRPWLIRLVLALAGAGVATHFISAWEPAGWPEWAQWVAGLGVPGLAIGLVLGLSVGGWRLAAWMALGAALGYGAATRVAQWLAQFYFSLGLGPQAIPWPWLIVGAGAYGVFGLVAGWPLGGRRLAWASAWRAMVAGVVGIGLHMGMSRLGFGWSMGPVMIPASLWVLAMAWLFPPVGQDDWPATPAPPAHNP